LPAAAGQELDHSVWDSLLKRYVNEESRVDYKTWKEKDAAALDGYIAQLARVWPRTPGSAEKAALINAYNALTIQWVLAHYPIASIWKTKKPFTAARHTVNGQKTSLDGIETRLRKTNDPRIHAALVCAARSCPPLRRESYAPETLDAQLDDNTRAWLANPVLNEFSPDRKRAEISSIFKWYRTDFPDLERFLAQYAPKDKFVSGAKIEHRSYKWGLNDQSALGENYSQAAFLFDAARHR
jgi:hypothetical protein